MSVCPAQMSAKQMREAVKTMDSSPTNPSEVRYSWLLQHPCTGATRPRKVRRERSRSYWEINKRKVKLQAAEKRNAKCKKREQREQNGKGRERVPAANKKNWNWFILFAIREMYEKTCNQKVNSSSERC